MLKMSFTISLAKNLSLNMVENPEICGCSDGNQNKLIKKLLYTSSSIKKTRYLNFYARKVFTQLRQVFI